ncbi:UNVERIFIED_CONTAM: hypothetical protein RMT77_006434 [Armadillidium vulgare]
METKGMSYLILVTVSALYGPKSSSAVDVDSSVNHRETKLDHKSEKMENKTSRKAKLMSFTPNNMFLPLYTSQLPVSNNVDYLRSIHSPNEDVQGRIFHFVGRPYVTRDESSSQKLHTNMNDNLHRVANAFESIAESLHTMSIEWEFNFSEPFLTMFISSLEAIAENVIPQVRKRGNGTELN